MFDEKILTPLPYRRPSPAFQRTDWRGQRRAEFEANYCVRGRTEASCSCVAANRSAHHHKFLATLFLARRRNAELKSRLRAPEARGATCVPQVSVNQTRVVR